MRARRRRRTRGAARAARGGSVERHDARGVADGERGPGGQAEVGMDDVETLLAEATPEVTGGAGIAARGEGEDLDVEPGRLLQRGDLVAHEAAARRRGRARPHARDDQGTHSRVILHRLVLSPSHDAPHTRRRTRKRTQGGTGWATG